MEEIIIDVREKDEFKHEHIPGSINLPLSCFAQDAPPLLEKFNNKKIILLCLSGKRAAMAEQQAKGMPALKSCNYTVYPEGIRGWKAAGKQVVAANKKAPIPLMRQVQVTAGSLIILSGILGSTVNQNFWYLSLFVGMGLTFAGISGFCGLGELLQRMPWNK